MELTFEQFQIEVGNTLEDCYAFRLKDLGDSVYTFDNIGGSLMGSYDGQWLVSHKLNYNVFGKGETLEAAIADMNKSQI